MKKTMKKLSVLLGVALLVGTTSCKKYEEGPGISFRSKASRVANTWIIDQYVDADGDIDKETDSDTFELTKDGKVTVTYGSTSQTGTWEFQKDKEEIKFNYEYYDATYTIIKLKNNEMWLADEDKDQIHFVSKN
jgi:hypothetical protein